MFDKKYFIVGILTGLLSLYSTQTYASPPEFLYEYSYESADAVKFGWFKKLDDRQMEYYSATQVYVVVYGDVGVKSAWKYKEASGYSRVLAIEDKHIGYCKHIQTVVEAFNQRKSVVEAVCHTYATGQWAWQGIR